MSKESARIRRSKKLRAKLQKVELMRIAISRSLKNITAQLIDPLQTASEGVDILLIKSELNDNP